MTAGYTGMNYFLYDNDTGGSNSGLFYDFNGNKTQLYHDVAAMNPEIARVGKVLRLLESEDVRFIRGAPANPTPTGLGHTHMQSAGVQGAVGAEQDGLIGFFTDDADQQYFMLTNLFHSATMTSAQTAMTLQLAFDNTINELLRINRQTGEPEKVVLNNHVLSVSLPGGTGELFKYNTGYFAGIPGGDADLDGDVDLSDLGALATFYGQNAGMSWNDGDFDFDGDVDLSDLGVLATYYGGGQAQAYAAFQAMTGVPEPATALSLTIVTLVFGFRRHAR
jgi:hypothetical protein